MNKLNIATIQRKGHISLMKGMSNILGLQNPDDFYCSIFNYTASHAMMQIWICEPRLRSNGFILHLSSVHYFSGFTDWNGANFRLLTDHEKETFQQQLGHHIHGFISEINSTQGKIHFSAIQFELEIKDYMPQFVEGVNL